LQNPARSAAPGFFAFEIDWWLRASGHLQQAIVAFAAWLQSPQVDRLPRAAMSASSAAGLRVSDAQARRHLQRLRERHKFCGRPLLAVGTDEACWPLIATPHG